MFGLLGDLWMPLHLSSAQIQTDDTVATMNVYITMLMR